MIRVTIESPYAGDVEANVAYAKRCVCDCLRRGESPYASHLFFTQSGLLDDLKPEERRLGIEAGLAWQRSSNVVAVYVDRGISEGMRQGIAAAAERGANIEVRSLEGPVTKDQLIEVWSAAKVTYYTKKDPEHRIHCFVCGIPINIGIADLCDACDKTHRFDPIRLAYVEKVER